MEASKVMKADSLRGIGSKIAFNYDDLQQRCDGYIETIRQQARKMVSDAHAEAEAIRQKAFSEGQAQGDQAGRNAAKADFERQVEALSEQKATARLKTALPALKEAAVALSIERDRWLTHWQESAIRLCAAIAEKILHQEIGRRPELAEKMIGDALQLAAGSPQIRLRMHPEDIQLFGSQCEQIISSMAPGGTAALIPDPQISRGGCVIETQHGVIDAQLETQIGRITAELLDDAD